MYGEFLLFGFLYLVVSTIWQWRRHFVTLKRSGLDVVVAREFSILHTSTIMTYAHSAIFIGAPIWLVVANVFMPLFNMLPIAWTKTWIEWLLPHVHMLRILG